MVLQSFLWSSLQGHQCHSHHILMGKGQPWFKQRPYVQGSIVHLDAIFGNQLIEACQKVSTFLCGRWSSWGPEVWGGSCGLWTLGDLPGWWTGRWRVSCLYARWSNSFGTFLYLEPVQCVTLCCSGGDFHIILPHFSMRCYVLGTCFILCVLTVPAI